MYTYIYTHVQTQTNTHTLCITHTHSHLIHAQHCRVIQTCVCLAVKVVDEAVGHVTGQTCVDALAKPSQA